MTAVDPAYRRLAGEGPHDAAFGGALITWVEPMPDHVAGYNRWYEDDHMITGAMVMPWMFSCRRWVAPKRLQHLRGPADSSIAVPLNAGKYIALYWINRSRIDDHQEWALGANYRLHAEGRGSYRGAGHDPLEERRHVFTAFCDYRGATYRDAAVPRDVHALMQPYQGLVVELYEAPSDAGVSALDAWLVDSHLPDVTTDPVAQSLRFTPRPLPADKLAHVKEIENPARIITVLHFIEADPSTCWDQFAGSDERVKAAGVGKLAVQAAFIPTHHGTNDYVDELF
jgi:hypothetical protein